MPATIKLPFSTVIITCVYVALTVGYVPHRSTNCHQLLRLNLQSDTSSVTSPEVLNFLESRFESQKVFDEPKLKAAAVNVKKGGMNMDKLWRMTRRTVASLTMVPLLLGGKIYSSVVVIFNYTMPKY